MSREDIDAEIKRLIEIQVKESRKATELFKIDSPEFAAQFKKAGEAYDAANDFIIADYHKRKAAGEFKPFNNTIMENNKPGYKEIWLKNYSYSLLFLLAAIVLSVANAIKPDSWDSGYQIAAGLVVLTGFIYFYGLRVYRKDFRYEISQGTRKAGW